jgi:hypothetical protein
MFRRAAIYSIALLISPVPSAQGRPVEIILLRHAEKPSDEKDPHLSPRGRERARELPRLFATLPAMTNSARPVVLIAPHPMAHAPSQRCMETLEPTARQWHLPLETSHAASDWDRLAKELLTSSSYDGKTVIVCWVHDNIPALAQALGVKKAPHWSGNTFDRLWVITFDGAHAVMLNLPQHLLPGDSSK